MNKHQKWMILWAVCLLAAVCNITVVCADVVTVDQDLTHTGAIVPNPEGTSINPEDNVSVKGLLDDFNRPNGPIGPNWTNRNGAFNVVNNAAQGGTQALATYNSATGVRLEGDVECNGTNLQYTGLVLAYMNITNNYFLKVQQQDGGNTFDHAAFYYGNNGSGYFFLLDYTFTTAHMTVELVGNTVTMTFSQIDGGTGVQTYNHTYGSATGGNGIGICGFSNTARMDNYTEGTPTLSLDGTPYYVATCPTGPVPGFSKALLSVDIFDAGEEAVLTLNVKNDGTEDATNVSATVTPISPNAEVLSATCTFPTIPAGESRTNNLPGPVVKAHWSTSCGALLEWEVALTSDQYQNTDTFQLEIGDTSKSLESLFVEDFDKTDDPFSTTLPPDWRTTDLTGTDNNWSTTHPLFGFSSPGNVTGGTGVAAVANSVATCRSGWWDAELYSPPIDLAMPPETGDDSSVTATLTFLSNFQDYHGAGQAWLDVSNDGGITWENLLYWTEDHDPGGPTVETVNLDAYLDSTIVLKWRYTDDGNGCAWFWQIDDVQIEMEEKTCVMTPCLGIDCFAMVSDDVIEAGDVVFFNAFGDTNCPTGVIYRWIFGDGKETGNPHTYHIYNVPGVYNWKLQVLAPDCDLICEETGTIIVENPFNLFIYDNDGTANLFLNVQSGRYQFEIFEGPHRGVYNGWGYFDDCWFPEEEDELAEFLCFYPYGVRDTAVLVRPIDYYFKFCFDMTHRIYRGDILFHMGPIMGAYTIFDNSNWVE